MRKERIKRKRKQLNCLVFPAENCQDKLYFCPSKRCSRLRRSQSIHRLLCML